MEKQGRRKGDLPVQLLDILRLGSDLLSILDLNLATKGSPENLAVTLALVYFYINPRDKMRTQN